MVAIFGVALLLPSPHRNRTLPAAAEPATDSGPAPGMGDDADARMWTSRARRWALRTLPPQKVLPDRQPAYVASWVPPGCTCLAWPRWPRWALPLCRGS